MKEKEDKIQTGMRIPKPLYDRLAQEAADSGISLNAYLLFLINLGEKVVRQSVEQCSHSVPHNLQDTV